MKTNIVEQPLNSAEQEIARQFVTTAQCIRQSSNDPDVAIAAANWEKRLNQLLAAACPIRTAKATTAMAHA